MSNIILEKVKLFFFIGDERALIRYIPLLVDFSLLFFVCIFLYELSMKEKKVKITSKEESGNKRKYSPFKVLLWLFLLALLSKAFTYFSNKFW